jgi:hypothetical protein
VPRSPLNVVQERSGDRPGVELSAATVSAVQRVRDHGITAAPELSLMTRRGKLEASFTSATPFAGRYSETRLINARRPVAA